MLWRRTTTIRYYHRRKLPFTEKPILVILSKRGLTTGNKNSTHQTAASRMINGFCLPNYIMSRNHIIYLLGSTYTFYKVLFTPGRNVKICLEFLDSLYGKKIIIKTRSIATIFIIFFLKDIQTIFNFCHNIYHRRRHTATKLLLLSSILFVIQVFFASLYTKHSHNIKQRQKEEKVPLRCFS